MPKIGLESLTLNLLFIIFCVLSSVKIRRKVFLHEDVFPINILFQNNLFQSCPCPLVSWLISCFILKKLRMKIAVKIKCELHGQNIIKQKAVRVHYERKLLATDEKVCVEKSDDHSFVLSLKSHQ